MTSSGEPSSPERPPDPPREMASDTEQRVQALVEDFLQRLRAGEDPDPAEVILAHPHLARELEQRLEAAVALFSLSGQSPQIPFPPDASHPPHDRPLPH